MRASTISLKKILRIARPALVLLFWLSVWELLALAVGNSYFLPSVFETLSALGVIIRKEYFWGSVLMTLLRVCAGLVLGIISGALLAFLCNRFSAVNAVVSPLISVIKATPVATFIVLLWIFLSGNQLTILIAFLMVLPIVWQNLSDGLRTISRELTEAADVFELSRKRRIRLIYFPTLVSYLFPAIVTSIGLAWKSEVAAEIIAYTKNSIGQHINDSKYFMDTPSVFAWTVVVVLISILFERGARALLSRWSK
ncbi:MAG: ABC transporter permease subunit [Clostridia bacterium]|nr:ABC transporter permease subunit [Clostridia bacterium]